MIYCFFYMLLGFYINIYSLRVDEQESAFEVSLLYGRVQWRLTHVVLSVYVGF